MPKPCKGGAEGGNISTYGYSFVAGQRDMKFHNHEVSHNREVS